GSGALALPQAAAAARSAGPAAARSAAPGAARSAGPAAARSAAPAAARSAAPAVLAVRVHAAPNPAPAGGPVTISGQVVSTSPAATPISLWERGPGQARFVRVLRRRADATGAFSIVRRPTTNVR